jgi:glycosidase
MQKVRSDALFDYYECRVQLSHRQVRYHFMVRTDDETVHFDRMGVSPEPREGFEFCVTPGFSTPAWSKGAVMYQIFVDRFCNGDTGNDVLTGEYIYIGSPVQRVTDWKKPPENLDVGCFYGGDLAGVGKKLDYLEQLGVEAIYFNPLFVSPSNHKYDCQDYDHIDPHFGAIPADGEIGAGGLGTAIDAAGSHDAGNGGTGGHDAGNGPAGSGSEGNGGTGSHDAGNGGTGGYGEGNGGTGGHGAGSGDAGHGGEKATAGGPGLPVGDVRYAQRTAGGENLDASNALFVRLVDEIHRRGMRVIIDGVFNHCGSFNKWMDREGIYRMLGGYPPGAYLCEESPYTSYFRFDNSGDWPKNSRYEGWWGHATLPKLNYEESAPLRREILGIARKWVSPPYNCDGWRLDVAADLGSSSEFNHLFWKEFRKAVKGANPDALIVAEHYGDPSDWLQGDQWDCVMNYDAFMEPVTWFLTGMEKHSDEYNPALLGDGETFFASMAYHMSRMQTPSLLSAMNELSNHDHSRFLTRTNHKVGRLSTLGAEAAGEGLDYGAFRAGVVMLMTWPGAPAVYYGDEVGLCGFTDPDSRRTYPWGGEDLELLEFHKYMIALHREVPALRLGSVHRLDAGGGLVAYGRSHGDSLCAVAVNISKEPRNCRLPVWKLGAVDATTFTRHMLTTANGYNVGAAMFTVRGGELEIDLEPNSSVVLANFRG